jgi:hypothetical protein
MSQPQSDLPRLGIIAGSGELPAEVVAHCKALGRDFHLIAFTDITNEDIAYDTSHTWVSIGKVGKIIKTLREEKVEDLLLVGKVGRPALSALQLDFTALRLIAFLRKLRVQGDDAIFSAIIKFLENQHFSVVGIDAVLADLLMPEGTLGDVEPDAIAKIDIELGTKIALEIGKHDIGQATIVQHGVVLGVEGAEGTDNLIRRCKTLHNEGPAGVLIKMCKPSQDRRVDLPSIGIDTVDNAHSSGLRGIAIEAGASLIINKEKVVKRANELGIFLVGVKSPGA